jgi:CRISPR system Cascade subunit CasB
MSNSQSPSDFRSTVARIAEGMRWLGTGDLAELRRMQRGDPGCPAFWNLAAKSGFIDEVGRMDAWMLIVKVMAILTPKGEPPAPLLHDPQKRLGTLLCDGGDPEWNNSKRPLLSEPRLMRLLAETPNRRSASIERIARLLAAKRKADAGINCSEIAELVLFPKRDSSARGIARDYYRRLDAAALQNSQKELA